MIRPIQAAAFEPEFVSLTEARRLLCVGKTTIHKLINQGQLATVKCGKKRLVRLSVIRNFGRSAAGGE